MKKTDIAMIVLIASVGVIIAYFIASSIPFLKLPEKGIEVETIVQLTPDVKEPSEQVFNDDAINPTVEVIIGSSGAD